MAGDANYLLIWFFYLASAAVFLFVFWKFTALLRRPKRLERSSAWILRTFMAALILTPVFYHGEAGTAVPALMALALDVIAAGPAAAARGLAALAAGMVAAAAAAMVLWLGSTLVRRGNFRPLRRVAAIARGGWKTKARNKPANPQGRTP